MEGLSPRLRKMLVTGVVDVAVLSLNVDPAHLILGASFTEPISLVGAKGDPLLDGDEPLTLAEIVDLPLIIAGIRKEGIRDIVERAFADVGLTPNKIGRASCRDRVCQYVSISVVAGQIKKK